MWLRLRSLRGPLDRFFTDRVILLFGWLCFLVYAYPGFMSYDSVYQLSQARDLEKVNEWHPPLMSLEWRITDTFISGPFPMLVIQSVTFLVAVYVLLGRVMSRRAAALTSVILLVVPQNIIVMAVIWKDSQMAAFLLAAIAGLSSEHRRWRVVGCAFLFLATAFRYNAAAATLPILLLLWDWRLQYAPLRRYVGAVSMWVAIAVSAVVISSMLVEEKKYPWHVGSAPVDIVGTIRFSPTLDDEQLLRDTAGVPWVHRDNIQDRARSKYRPYHSFLDVTQGEQPLIEYITTEEHRAAVAAAWRELVLAHPLAFLRHRVGVFFAQLDWPPGVWAGFTNADWGENLVQHRAKHSAVQRAWIDAMTKTTRTKLMRVRLYFWLAVVLLPLCRRHRMPLVLLSSGVLYQLGLLLVAPAIDYRYAHWLVMSTIVGTIMLLIARMRGRSDVGAQRRIERAA